jgi:hypothetical protein
MSIASLATGDTVYVVRESEGDFGNSVSYAIDATLNQPLDCLVQEVSSRESSVLDALGLKRGYEVFFATDPGIDGDETDLHLLWTSRTDGNRVLGDNAVGVKTGFRMKVVGAYAEGAPGHTELWIVVCSTTQQLKDGS